MTETSQLFLLLGDLDTCVLSFLCCCFNKQAKEIEGIKMVILFAPAMINDDVDVNGDEVPGVTTGLT